ncbi:MAG: YdeI/OmpD-associated family protein [Actinomycetota bacterium]
MRFRAELELGGKTATGVEVPEAVVAALRSGKRPAVRVTINGYTYRSTVASMGGRFMLGVSAEVREKAGVSAGDVVDIELKLDTEPRDVTVPPELAKAIGRDKRSKATFESLSYSRKQRLVLPIEQAKTEATRKRNVDKAMDLLREGRA